MCDCSLAAVRKGHGCKLTQPLTAKGFFGQLVVQLTVKLKNQGSNPASRIFSRFINDLLHERMKVHCLIPANDSFFFSLALF